MSKGGYKRRKLIVSGMQYKLAAVTFLYFFALILMIAASVVAPLIVTVDDESLGAADRDAAARQLLGLYEATWATVPVAVVLCLFHSVLVSHRIAGPLYRFKQCFRELATGNLALIVRIRRADYLEDEAKVMNEMIQDLASKVQDIEERFASASHTLPELTQAIERQDRQETAVLCGKLGTQLDELGRRIHVFRLPTDTAVATHASTEKPVESTV